MKKEEKKPSTTTVSVNHCERCGHDWIGRVEDPIQCARCHSPYWKIPLQEGYKPARVLEKRADNKGKGKKA